MRAQLAALAVKAPLAAVALAAVGIAWTYAVERSDPVVGLAALAMGTVAAGWFAWLRRRRRRAS